MDRERKLLYTAVVRFNVMYKELLRLAASIRRADANATISTSTLVHELWVKLAKSPDPGAPVCKILRAVEARPLCAARSEGALQRQFCTAR
jgi:hypothetical protein